MGADVRVEIGAPTGVEVAPDLWGLFFEDINNCLDGGLNAELVRNGDFEFDQFDHPGWHATTGWSVEGDGKIEVLVEDPVHPNNRAYVRAVGPVSLVNDGWDGVGVRAGDAFRLSLATWRVSGAGDLRAAVVGEDRAVLAEAAVGVPEGGWSWVNADLVGSADGRGRFRIDVPNGLTVELDVISLRPVGEDGAPLTFRPDLLAALKELHPSFVRFPGGCVAHGAGVANMYRWKSTIGPRFTRVHAVNGWGYHQSRQIGYLEYFELCEELGAAPLPVVPAAVCCQNVRGGAVALSPEEMPEYVQEVLDLVEFANGPVDSRWGSVRAELGHAEPFGLRYLGVGNEDAITDVFKDRYAQIEDALRAAHPEITVIGTAGPAPSGHDWEAGWQYARERGTDIVDEHAYCAPRWLHQNTERYAAYSREEPGVYLGEYAGRSNKVRSALAEAAFMIGMERNSDVVRLASYAPLLARIGGTGWEPDLIYFDAERVLPSASYYVQQLFGRHRGTALRHVTLTGVDPVPVTIPASGTARLRSPGSAFTVTDVVLDGVPVDPARTIADGGDVALGEIDPSACVVELTATRTEGTSALAIRIGAEDPGNFLEVVVPARLSTIVTRYDDGIAVLEDGPVPWRGLTTGEPVRIRVELDGARVRVLVDGQVLHDYVQDLRPENRVVVGAASRTAPDGVTEHVVRLVNATDDPRRVTVVLPEGDGRVTGTVHLLAGAGPDEGDLFEPSPVTPVEVTVSGDVSGEVCAVVGLPAWSFAVAVLRAA